MSPRQGNRTHELQPRSRGTPVHPGFQRRPGRPSPRCHAEWAGRPSASVRVKIPGTFGARGCLYIILADTCLYNTVLPAFTVCIRTRRRSGVRPCGAGRVYNDGRAGNLRVSAGQARGVPEFDFGRRYTRLKAQEGNEWLREIVGRRVRGTGALPLGAAFAHFSRRIASRPRAGAIVHDPGRREDSGQSGFGCRTWLGWVRLNRNRHARGGPIPWGGGEARVATGSWTSGTSVHGHSLIDRNSANRRDERSSSRMTDRRHYQFKLAVVKVASNPAAKAKRKAAEIRKDFSHPCPR